MFFYLLKNSTIVDNNYDIHSKNTKILIYGSICYILLHATLFLGGKDALLYSLKPYFWLFLILDISFFKPVTCPCKLMICSLVVLGVIMLVVVPLISLPVRRVLIRLFLLLLILWEE